MSVVQLFLCSCAAFYGLVLIGYVFWYGLVYLGGF